MSLEHRRNVLHFLEMKCQLNTLIYTVQQDKAYSMESIG